MDSEMGVGRNWSSDSADSVRKVEASSRESCRTVCVSMASGCRKASRLLEGLTDEEGAIMGQLRAEPGSQNGYFGISTRQRGIAVCFHMTLRQSKRMGLEVCANLCTAL